MVLYRVLGALAFAWSSHPGPWTIQSARQLENTPFWMLFAFNTDLGAWLKKWGYGHPSFSWPFLLKLILGGVGLNWGGGPTYKREKLKFLPMHCNDLNRNHMCSNWGERQFPVLLSNSFWFPVATQPPWMSSAIPPTQKIGEIIPPYFSLPPSHFLGKKPKAVCANSHILVRFLEFNHHRFPFILRETHLVLKLSWEEGI